MNSDFRDLLQLLNEEKSEYLLVGAHAVIFYSEPRYTKDIDIWVSVHGDNPEKVYRALKRFGAPVSILKIDEIRKENLVYQMGVPPNRIDILFGIDGISFSEAWPNRVISDYAGVQMNLISKEDLIRNKTASGRPQDLLDLSKLTRLP